MGFAQAGKAFVGGENLAIQGAKPSGIAAQGQVIWRVGVSAFASATPTASQAATTGNVGYVLQFTANGHITAIRHWRVASDNPPSRSVYLWRQSDGTKLASATTSEAGLPDGWVTTLLTTPVAVVANDILIPSYDVPAVTVAFDSGQIASGTTYIVSSSGIYNAAVGLFPNTTAASNYFADVLFQPS
jgi:hypothetical protein